MQPISLRRTLLAGLLFLVGMPGAHQLIRAAESPAGAAPLVQPGAWTVTPQPTGGATMSYQFCFKTGSLDDVKLLLPNVLGGNGCAPAAINLEAGQLSWKLTCTTNLVEAEARYRISSDRIEGSFTIVQGNPGVRSSQSILARFAGACQP